MQPLPLEMVTDFWHIQLKDDEHFRDFSENRKKNYIEKVAMNFLHMQIILNIELIPDHIDDK